MWEKRDMMLHCLHSKIAYGVFHIVFTRRYLKIRSVGWVISFGELHLESFGTQVIWANNDIDSTRILCMEGKTTNRSLNLSL